MRASALYSSMIFLGVASVECAQTCVLSSAPTRTKPLPPSFPACGIRVPLLRSISLSGDAVADMPVPTGGLLARVGALRVSSGGSLVLTDDRLLLTRRMPLLLEKPP